MFHRDRGEPTAATEAPRKRGADRAPAPGVLTGESLIQLQRSAGNSATIRALSRSQPVIQRKVEWGNKPDANLDGFLAQLSALVERMAIAALEPESLRATRKVTNLLLAYQSYAAGGRQVVPQFLYARYGYVVEELVNEQILQGALNAHLPAPPATCSYVIQVQGGRGLTRPDVVVQQRDAGGQLTDVAWFDISSDSRAGGDLHIWDKAGWKSKAYSGEAQYPVLDPMQLGTGSMSMVEGIKLRRGHERYLAEMRSRFTKVDREIRAESQAWKEKPNSKRQKSLEEALGEFFGEGKLAPNTAKSILGLVGRELYDQDNYWTSEFRYRPGRDHSSKPLLLIDSLEP